MRYLFPFMLLSMAFWALHSMVLDPMPNAFKRQEFIRYRREMLYITSKLNFRSPAREVSGLWGSSRNGTVLVWNMQGNLRDAVHHLQVYNSTFGVMQGQLKGKMQHLRVHRKITGAYSTKTVWTTLSATCLATF